MKEIRPIRSEKDYLAALAEIERLIDSEPGTSGSDRLEILSILVEAYEERFHQIACDDISPIEAIKFWLEQNNMTRKDLEPFLGSRARVSEIMTGKRSLSMAMIRKLVGAGIPAELLIQPLPVEKAA
ncbi:MAG: transcriptional regulator [Candidatus Riflebacteria bacterium HGW-Riflebacteria-1]|jgi:HTH-type transcriptional regulator/antitoxin HigA|nr:MAG: transcriptional regulator [Candidatus Riflebacteria bacterium HGW-Riflebacteria-1]